MTTPEDFTSGVSDAPSSPHTARHRLVADVLEACRVEIVGRCDRLAVPYSMRVPQLSIIPTDGAGWRSERTEAEVSSLRSFDVMLRLADDSVAHAVIGLRSQLEPLAQRLNKETDLGVRQASLLPAMTGVDAILTRYLTRLAVEYLSHLRSLGERDDARVAQLAQELDQLADPHRVLHTDQMAIDGLVVALPIEYREVSLRPLTPAERGLYWQSRNGDDPGSLRGHGDFVVPREFSTVTPSALLSVTTTRPRSEAFSKSTLLSRVALALYLRGFDIASTGVMIGFDRPLWATLASNQPRSLVGERHVDLRELAQADFEAAVDLAYRMPEFGPAEESSHEIALYRTLRGLGMHWQESGFLDFTIALEATLLEDTQVELAYKFALYGALFLRAELPPAETFRRLRDVYSIRSRLVHGGSVKPEWRQQAERDAADIARAVMLKAIEEGWPNSQQLNGVALTAGLGGVSGSASGK